MNRWRPVAMLLAAGCGCAASPVDSDRRTAASERDEEVRAPSLEPDDDSSIEIVVVLPDNWPNPIYPGSPDVVVEAEDGAEFRMPASGERATIRLPSRGDYSVGAVVEDAGCIDTAGMTQAGNPAVSLDDGDVFTLQDTGEICD